MRLTLADWSIVALYFLFNVAVGLYYKRRAGRDTAEFFLSGRNVPWWLAGTSMVATTFAADTPLAVTGLVARDGGAGDRPGGGLGGGGLPAGVFFARGWGPAGGGDRARVLGSPVPRRAGGLRPGVPALCPGGA